MTDRTKYGFKRLSGAGEPEPRRASIPAPRGRPEGSSHAAHDAERQAARAAEGDQGDPDEAPLLRRVEQELAAPAHFAVGTHAGRAIAHDAPTAQPLSVEAAPEDGHGDALLRPRLSPWRRAWEVVWPAGPWVIRHTAAVVLLAAVVLGVGVWLLGGDDAKAPARLPAATDSERPAADDVRAAAPRARRSSSERLARTSTAAASGAGAPVDLGEAGQLLAQHLCRDAVQLLRRLVKGSARQSAEAHQLLGRALICQQRATAGLAALRRAIALDPGTLQRQELLEDLTYLLTRPPTATGAVELLGRIGAAAEQALLGAATHRSLAVRRRAVASLERLGATGKIDWLTVLSLDLEQQPCAGRRGVIERLRELDDPRALQVLEGARTRRNACVRGELDRAIAELKQRQGSEKKPPP